MLMKSYDLNRGRRRAHVRQGRQVLDRRPGLIAVAAIFGIATTPLDVRLAPVWLPIIFIYPLLFAKTTHDVSVRLLDRSRRLRELSECDSLTGLANRPALSARLHALLNDPARHG